MDDSRSDDTNFDAYSDLYLDSSQAGFRLGGQGFLEDWQSMTAPVPFGRVNDLRPSSLSGSSMSSSSLLQRQGAAATSTRRIQQLEQMCSGLKKENLVLSTENQAIKRVIVSSKHMCAMLVDRIPALLSDSGTVLPAGPRNAGLVLSTNSAAPLIQSDYPLILWWDQQDWTAHLTENSGMSTGSAPGPRGSTRAAAGINVTMLYVQYATGDVINGFRATEIKGFATQLFNEMARAGIDPATWHTGGRDIQQHFYAEIGASYLKRKAKQDPDPTSVKRAKKEETQDGQDLNDMYTMPDDILAEQSPVTGNTNVDASASSSLAVEPPKISIKIVNPFVLRFSSPPPEPQPENNEAPTELTAVSSASSESPPAALPLLTPEPGSSTATTTFNSAQGVTSVTVTLPDSALVEPDAAVDGAVLPATPQTAGTTPSLPIQPAMPAPPVVPVAPAEPAAAFASAPATITDGPKKESVMKQESI
ncbi:hypothetical protein B0H10DRAFT_1971104 [Mycena sp. CBHHK59/15]|nr:hypothetical protein B0H10DRAFT_1971104 [Mycena sp. CBHHK59/15]